MSIKMLECKVKEYGTRKLHEASEFFELELGCGEYCDWIGEYCENAGLVIIHNGRKLSQSDECECSGKCWEEAGYEV